jgi:hypothetical protein
MHDRYFTRGRLLLFEYFLEQIYRYGFFFNFVIGGDVFQDGLLVEVMAAPVVSEDIETDVGGNPE